MVDGHWKRFFFSFCEKIFGCQNEFEWFPIKSSAARSSLSRKIFRGWIEGSYEFKVEMLLLQV